MQEVNQLIKLLPAADEKDSQQANLQNIKNQVQTYLDQHFAKELEGLNSFEALQALSDKLNQIKNFFPEIDFKTTQAQIEKKQLSFIPPSRWQELNEHSLAWELLRKHYSDLPSVDKATFIQAFQTSRMSFLPIADDIPAEIKDIVHYFSTGNDAKGTDLLVNLPLSVLNQIFFPLYFATIRNCDYVGVILDLLLAKGVDPNLVNHHGETALHCAAKCDSSIMVARLLHRNVDTTKTNAEGKTALQVAASLGRVYAVRELLRNTPEGKAIAEQKTTLVHWAAAGGYTAMFTAMPRIEVYYNTRIQDSEGLTPYLCAIHNGQLKAAQYLSSYETASKIKALCLAARQGHVAVFNWLLDRVANAVAKDEDGKDCLAYTLENGNPEIILAACKAKINHHALTKTEIQAVLQLAYQKEHKETCEFFLSFVNERKEDFPLLNYIHDSAAMLENDAKRIKELADYIYSKLQILNINGLPAEMAFKRLSYYTPRQLAQLKRIDSTLNILINDETFIKQLVTAYGLEEEYAEVGKQVTESEKNGKPSRGHFAKFYKVYLRTWIYAEREVSYLAEELLLAMATGKEDTVIALLERKDHADVQNVAYPLRWAARKGHLVYAAQLIQLRACSDSEVGSVPSALIEAAKHNRVACIKILLPGDVPMKFCAALKAAAARGHLPAINCLLDNKGEVDHATVLEVLVLAAIHGQAVIVSELLERIIRDNSYQEHSRDLYRLEALKAAVAYKHAAVVLALVKETTLPALEVPDDLKEACRLKAPQLVTALLTARNVSQRDLHGVFEIAAAESNLECVTLLLNDSRILQDEQLDITRALVSASRKVKTEETFNFLMAKNETEPQKYKILRERLESEINQLMGGNNTQHVIALLCHLAPFVINLEEKLIWACWRNQPAVIQALLRAHPRIPISDTLLKAAISSEHTACLTELLNAVAEPNYSDLIVHALTTDKENMAMILFKRWQGKGFARAIDILPLARAALINFSPKLAQGFSVDRLKMVQELLNCWQKKNLLSLHKKNTIHSFASTVSAFCLGVNSDMKAFCYCDALLDICDEILDFHLRKLQEKQKKSKLAQTTPREDAEIGQQQTMLDLLRSGVEQLREQKNPKIELVVASYLLTASIFDERFSDQQKLDIIQAYQAFVKPWWQTYATALVCILSGAIGLVLGAAAGVGIGILAGSWSGPGMALTALAGALAGSVQGATLGVAAGAAVTGLVAGTAGLLAAKGLFKSPEQQLAVQLDSQIPRLK